MTLSKKGIVFIFLALLAVFFVLLLLLPEGVIGHRDDEVMLFVPKLLFLALSAAITTIVVLILIFKRDYMRAQFNTFNRFKYYLRLLVKRDFITKYRKSILGVLWSLLNPLLTMFVMTLVFRYLFRFQIPHFAAYILSGQIIFTFFNESTTLAMTSIIANEGVIRKIYVPKYIFPLSKVISSLVNLGLSFIAFLIVFIFVGPPFQWTFLLLPIPIIFVFVFSLGMAMLISSLAVFFRDLTYIYGVLTLLWMYLTPIFWPIEILDGIMVQLIGLNPMYQFIYYFRCLTLWGTIPDLWTNMVCIGFALTSFCAGTFVFMRQQDRYILSM